MSFIFFMSYVLHMIFMYLFEGVSVYISYVKLLVFEKKFQNINSR